MTANVIGAARRVAVAGGSAVAEGVIVGKSEDTVAGGVGEAGGRSVGRAKDWFEVARGGRVCETAVVPTGGCESCGLAAPLQAACIRIKTAVSITNTLTIDFTNLLLRHCRRFPSGKP